MASQNQDRYTSDRGFDTLNNSAVARREQKARLQTTVFRVLIVLAAVLVLCIIGLIVAACVSTPGSDTPDNPQSATKVSIKWASLTATQDDAKNGSLILVNTEHPSAVAETSERLTDLYSFVATTADGTYKSLGLSSKIDKECAAALDEMLKACEAAVPTKSLNIRYVYRAASESETDKDFTTGLGVELRIMTSDGNKNIANNQQVYDWLTQNAKKYGFVFRYPTDKAEKTGVPGSSTNTDWSYYLRYVGVPHAMLMADAADGPMCLEEYIEDLKANTGNEDGRRKVYTENPEDENSRVWEIYYVPAQVNGDTTVPVPSNFEYDISGTNEGGFIVTILRTALINPDTDTVAEGQSEAATVSDR